MVSVVTSPRSPRNGMAERRAGGGGGVRRGWIVLIGCNALFAAFVANQLRFCGDGGSAGTRSGAKVKVVKKPPPPVVVVPSQSNETPAVMYSPLGGDPYALARSQSFGFFYDVTEENWNMFRQIYLEHENHRYPEKPLTFNPKAQAHQADPTMYSRRNNHPGWSSYSAWYQNNYEPNFSCPFERRVGEPMNGDGPKWVCDPHRIKKLAEARRLKDPDHPGCVVYSIGSNGDFSFELGMQNAVGEGTCEFHIFDMEDYSKVMPARLKRAHFHKWGLKKQGPPRTTFLGKAVPPSPGEKFYGLLDTVRLLGHEDLDVVDVFKIDCEHCEWETYKDWLSDEVPMLHQIQVELHQVPVKEDAGAIDLFDSFERAGYLRFHKEANIQWGADCIEYAFIKVDTAFVEGKELHRTSLTEKNHHPLYD